MALKSIIDVEVNDDKFKAFFDLFQQYQARVDSLPESWSKVGASTDKNTEAFGALVGETAKSVHHASAMVEQLRKATVVQKDFHVAARGAGKTLSDMAKSAESLGKSIFGIGAFLGKMAALGIGTSALGLFGMDSLGRGAVGGQREARGLGLNQGQVNAFKTDFGRYVDPSMLNKVAEAQSSFTGRVYLGMASGLSQSQVQDMGPDQLSIMLAQRASNWWKTTPAALRTEENLKATGFGQSGFSMEDMRRLGNTPSSDLSSAAGQYGKDAQTLRVQDETVSEWYKLTRQLHLAGQVIENVLVTRLSGLAPILGDLTTKLAKDLDIFLATTLTKENINSFATSLSNAVTYIGSKEFQQNIRDFGTAVSDVTHLILGVAKFFGGGDKSPSDAKSPDFKIHQNKPKDYSLMTDIKDSWNNWGKDTPGAFSNNVGNLRPYGKSKGFQKFKTQEEGEIAMANLLRSYPKAHHANTIASILGTYAPSSDKNDTESYIEQVSKMTGYGANQPLDLSRNDTLANLMHAMIKREKGRDIPASKIIVDIRNATGNNLSVQVASAAR